MDCGAQSSQAEEAGPQANQRADNSANQQRTSEPGATLGSSLETESLLQ